MQAITVSTVKRSAGSLWARIAGYCSQAGRRRDARQLRLKETLSLGEKRQLFLVECGKRQILIGTAGSFMTTLTELAGQPGTESDPRE